MLQCEKNILGNLGYILVPRVAREPPIRKQGIDIHIRMHHSYIYIYFSNQYYFIPFYGCDIALLCVTHKHII